MSERPTHTWIFEVKEAVTAAEPNADGQFVAYRWHTHGPFATEQEAAAARRDQLALRGPTCVTHLQTRAASRAAPAEVALVSA